MINLKNARSQLDLTQKKMAEILDISLPTYVRYENGKQEVPGGVQYVTTEKIDSLLKAKKGNIWNEEHDRIKNNLIDNLKEKGTNTPVFLDLVDRYMQMWITCRKLELDIQNRGVSTETSSGFKKNESVPLLVNVNKQMLIILDKLNLNASSNKPVGGIDV